MSDKHKQLVREVLAELNSDSTLAHVTYQFCLQQVDAANMAAAREKVGPLVQGAHKQTRAAHEAKLVLALADLIRPHCRPKRDG